MSKNENQISLANFFIYNTEFGHKEGREAEKIFYYYPPEEKIERQCRLAGFCAGITKFTETFKPSKPCESVHTEKMRLIFHQVDQDFWIVIGLNIPYNSNDKKYNGDQVSDQIYMSVLKQVFNLYKLFNGTLDEHLKKFGPQHLRDNLKQYFDYFIKNKLNVIDCDIMNTFNGIQFMSLDRSIYLKIQCMLNLLEEKVPLVNKTIVMHHDQLIWSGLEQEDVASLYAHLREMILSNANSPGAQSQPSHVAKFLVNESMLQKMNQASAAKKSTSSPKKEENSTYFELEKVFIDKPLRQFYMIPYSLSKLTFFIFISVDEENFHLSILKEIDAVLGSFMLSLLQEIADQQIKRSIINPPAEKEIRYIYFNRLNLAQKTTLNSNSKDIPKYIITLIAQLAKDLDSCQPTGEIFVKSGKEFWIACKKSDLREVYVVVNQKNANLILIDEEVKQLCSTDFSNIFFMD